jgi:DNA adenine methylase
MPSQRISEPSTSVADGGPSKCRPFLRWAGSKRQVVPILSEYWLSHHERYVEPFCGSSALFFLLAPASAVLSDSNADLIQFYKTVQVDPVTIWKGLHKLQRNRETYLRIRASHPTRLSETDRAIRFLYLNRNCFNGLYRTNRAGQFNVPFAPVGTGQIPTLAEFIASASQLERASLRNCDFGHTLRTVRTGDFVYLDPPYFVGSRRVFRDYGPKSFGESDIDRLGRHLDAIDARGATFLLSFADCADIKAIARNWDRRRIRVRRNIAGFAAHRRSAYELVISNTTR